jgi:hypothetical protein
MPPRKDKLSKGDFRELVRQKGIRFEGPAPPREWPPEYASHFNIIRCIETTRYDNYRANLEITRQHRDALRERVQYLRKKAYAFLDDATVNEATWRELEQHVLKRFDEHVIWYVEAEELGQ